MENLDASIPNNKKPETGSKVTEILLPQNRPNQEISKDDNLTCKTGLEKLGKEAAQKNTEDKLENDILDRLRNNTIEDVRIDKAKLFGQYRELREELGTQTEISPLQLGEFLKLSKASKNLPKERLNELNKLKDDLNSVSDELATIEKQNRLNSFLTKLFLSKDEGVKLLENKRSLKERNIRALEKEIEIEERKSPNLKGITEKTEKELIFKQLNNYIDKRFEYFEELKTELSSNEYLRDQLNREFMQNTFSQEIADLVENNKIKKEDSGKFIDFTTKLLKEGAKYYENPGNDYEISQRKNFDELHEIPEPIKYILRKYKVIDEDRDQGWLNANPTYKVEKKQNSFNEFFELLVKQDKYDFARNLIGKIDKIPISPEDRQSLLAKLKDEKELDIVKMDFGAFDNIFTDEVFGKWNTVKENEKVRGIIGKETFDNLEEKITEKMKLEILNGLSIGMYPLPIRYNLEKGDELFREALIAYIAHPRPEASYIDNTKRIFRDRYGLEQVFRSKLNLKRGKEPKDVKELFSNITLRCPAIASYIDEFLLKGTRYNEQDSKHKRELTMLSNKALRELPVLLSEEKDPRFKLEVLGEIITRFSEHENFSEEKQAEFRSPLIQEDTAKEYVKILKEVLTDKQSREELFTEYKDRIGPLGKLPEDLSAIFTNHHFADSALLYDIVTEFSEKEVFFFSKGYLYGGKKDVHLPYKKEKGYIRDYNLSNFVDIVVDPFRYPLNDEVYEKNLPKLKADIDLSIKAVNEIKDPQIGDKAREKIILALMEPDLLDREKALDLARKIHDISLKEKMISYVEDPKNKIERVIEKVKSVSERNMAIIKATRLRPEDRERFEDKSEDREKYEKELENVEATHRVSYNVPWHKAIKILVEGRIKTVRDAGLSWHEAGYTSRARETTEKNLSIRATGSKNDRHPISGAMYSKNGHDEKFGAAGQYGDSFLLLKNDNIKNRTFFYDGDSGFGKITSCIDWESAKKLKALKEVSKRGTNDSFPFSQDYIEALVLGGVTIEDIESVNINKGQLAYKLERYKPEQLETRYGTKNIEEIIKKLADLTLKHKIKFNVIE